MILSIFFLYVRLGLDIDTQVGKNKRSTWVVESTCGLS